MATKEKEGSKKVMFKHFKEAVAQHFDSMKGYPLFRTDVEKELLWLTYLESFPEGSNPILLERTEHDCQSCKSFIRAVGSLVAVSGDELISLWDCDVDEPYKTVARALSKLVKSAPIKNVLLHDQKSAGVDENYQETSDGVLTWKHFHIVLPDACVVPKDRGSVYSKKRSTRDVFARALEEIDWDSIETVVELIDQGSLYRGDEHLHAVKEFSRHKRFYDGLDTERAKEIFTWRQGLSPAVSRIRSSVIGTLLVDLSEGKGLDAAVRSFEAKVAPANYKRPKALVTKAMVDRARKSVDELGYTSALGRRFATLEDISVNNVLFANRDARRAMSADVFDEIADEIRTDRRSLEKVEKVSIDVFIESILPKASSIDLLFENRHAGNLVNLVAPRDPEAKGLFKWNNNFSWAYAGDLADSIKERVKARGGSVTGDFRASLSWFNLDDLDLHLIEPDGFHIHYGNKVSDRTGGNLDVDMNVRESGPKTSRGAVENITYPRRGQMLEGTYELKVHNYTHRESIDVGFEVEVEFAGETYLFALDREVRSEETVSVVTFSYTCEGGLKIIKSLPRQSASKTLWGISTESFHPVSTIMLSPNHWDDRPVGNKHWFFIIQKCMRERSSRGFFNEYLLDSLREHRKVFEVLGSKMRTEEEGEQLSGLGFSSTRRNNVFCKVSGAFARTVNITF